MLKIKVALLAGLFFCGAVDGSPVDTFNLDPIRIGMIDGLSGSFANAGEAVVRNLQFAIENINAAGGVR